MCQVRLKLCNVFFGIRILSESVSTPPLEALETGGSDSGEPDEDDICICRFLFLVHFFCCV